MKRFILVLAIICSGAQVAAQQFYIASANGIASITISNGIPTTQTLASCTSTNLLGIALHGTSFYYIVPFGNGSELFKGDINNNIITNCKLLADLTGVTPNSLTVDNNNILYYVAVRDLYKIDPVNPIPIKLGTLPFTSGGDLAFYNNDLYMASPNSIVKINMANPAISTVYISVPLTASSLFGLTAVTVNNTVEFYAFAVSGSYTNVLELDMANQKVVGTLFTLPYLVYDAASLAEGGTTQALHLDAVTVTQQCNLQNKGQIQVSAKPDAANAVLTYSLNNATTNTIGLFTNLSPGSYGLQVSSTTGTQKDTTINVPDYTFSKNSLSILKTNPVCNLSGKIRFNIPNANLYSVQYNVVTFPSDHVFADLATGDYSFTLFNQGGCPIDTVDITLVQGTCIPAVTFPNTFTPNNDGVNDIFKPNSSPTVTTYKLSIYDRWGSLMFVSADINTGWDGLYHGKPTGTGTYYWIAAFTSVDGVKNLQNGSVTLIR